MAIPTNTYLTTADVARREDLSDIVYKISPTATPVLTRSAVGKATNTLHQWTVQELAGVVVNRQIEGDDAAGIAVTPVSKLTNQTQISTKTVIVSGSEQAANTAGIKNMMGFQLSLKSAELKRDMESDLCASDVLATAPRQSRGLRGWLVDNVNRNGGTIANYTSNTGYTVLGTLRPFTESQVKDVLQQQYAAGGEPDTIMLPPALKQTFSGFTGNSTRIDKGEDGKVFAATDFYVSDFGTIEAVPNRFMPTRDVYLLQSDKLAVCYYRSFMTKDLAPTGDAEKKEIIVEWTLEARAPKAHGAIYDVQ